jgi:hypothetical protein
LRPPIVPTAAIAGTNDANLVAIDVTSQLPEARTMIILRRGTYLRRHLVDFVRMIAPAWSRARMQRHLDSSID